MSARPSPTPASGAPSSALLDGKYELIRCLGKGGMGEVWEAEHAKLGRRVAIKFIHAEAAKHADTLQRFQNEARASAKLQSRFIVQVIDDGVDRDGRPYIVMEKLLGESLGDRLERVRALDPEALRLILRDVCRGLTVAHEAGIVHRDLKPDNIFLHRGPDDDHETAKLVDFGIAKITEGAQGPGQSTTQTGSLLGTPLYMSPEQARGAKPIDARTDIWSLGVVVYESLTGDVPFRGSTVGDIAIHICLSEHDAPSARQPGLLPTIDGWMSRALAKDKKYRFPSAAEMFAAFEQVLAGQSIEPPPPTPPSVLHAPVTGESDTLDLGAHHPGTPGARQPASSLPRALKATESGAAAATSDDRPLTLGPVASPRPGLSPARRAFSRGLLVGAGIVAVGLLAAGFNAATRKSEELATASSQGLAGAPKAPPEQASAAPSATTPAAVSAAATPGSATSAVSAAPAASNSGSAARPPGTAPSGRVPGGRPPPGGKKGGAGGDELGY
jgi:serine/threonine-protein kinase